VFSYENILVRYFRYVHDGPKYASAQTVTAYASKHEHGEMDTNLGTPALEAK